MAEKFGYCLKRNIDIDHFALYQTFVKNRIIYKPIVHGVTIVERKMSSIWKSLNSQMS